MIKTHYDKVVRRDSLLIGGIKTTSTLPRLVKTTINCGGDIFEENISLSYLLALKLITGKTPYLLYGKNEKVTNNTISGGKLTLRGYPMYSFLFKFLYQSVSKINDFSGMRLPHHEKTYSFSLRDVFSFKEIDILYPYFQEVKNFDCHFYFTSNDTKEILSSGRGLLFCFVA